MQRRDRKPSQKKGVLWYNRSHDLDDPVGDAVDSVFDWVSECVVSIRLAFNTVFGWISNVAFGWISSVRFGWIFTVVFERIHSMMMTVLDTIGLYSSRIKAPVSAPIYVNEAEKITVPSGAAAKTGADLLDKARDLLHENTLMNLRKERNDKLLKGISETKTYEKLVKAARKGEYVQTAALSVLFAVERVWIFLTWIGTPAYLFFSSLSFFLVAVTTLFNAVLVFKNPADALFNEKTGLFSFLNPEIVRSRKKEESLKTRNPGQEQSEIYRHETAITVIRMILDYTVKVVLTSLVLFLSVCVLTVTMLISLYIRLFLTFLAVSLAGFIMILYLVVGVVSIVLLRLLYYLGGKLFGMNRPVLGFTQVITLIKRDLMKILRRNPPADDTSTNIYTEWDKMKDRFRTYEAIIWNRYPNILGLVNLTVIKCMEYTYFLSISVGSVSRLLFNIIGLLLEKLSMSKIMYAFLFLYTYSLSETSLKKITVSDPSLVFLLGNGFSFTSSLTSRATTIHLITSVVFALTTIWSIFQYWSSLGIQQDKMNLYWGLEEQSKKRQSITYNTTTVLMVGCLLFSLGAAICISLQPIELRFSTAIISYAWLSACMFIKDIRLLSVFSTVSTLSYGIELALLSLLLLASISYTALSAVTPYTALTAVLLGAISTVLFFRAREKDVFERVQRSDRGLFWFITLIRLAAISAIFMLFQQQIIDSILRIPILADVLVTNFLEGISIAKVLSIQSAANWAKAGLKEEGQNVVLG